MKNIYAVIWMDGALGIPLHLIKDSAYEAVESAKSIAEKTKDEPLKIQHLRAVSLAPNSDELINLWKVD